MKDANQNSSQTFVSAYVPLERLIRGRRWPAMMGPRSPIIKSGPQAISCGQRQVLAAMARLAKVIVPTRVPTLPSRYSLRLILKYPSRHAPVL